MIEVIYKQEKTEEELKQIYNNVNDQDRELFIKQLMHFREIMCSKEYSIIRKDKEFECLTTAYFRCKLEESDITAYLAICDEYQRRMEYELLNKEDNENDKI